MNPAPRVRSLIGAEGPIREAIALCGPHLRYAILFSALINLAFLAPTFYMLGVYDMVMPSGSGVTLLFFTLALVLTLLVLVCLEQVRVRIMSAAGVRLDRTFATRLFARAMVTPAGRGGPRVSQLIREADQIRAALTGPAALALMDAPWTPIYILVCFVVHPAIGALALFGCVILFALALWNERVTRDASARALHAGSVSFAAQDAAGSVAEVVRSLGMSDAFVRRFQDARGKSHLPQLAGARATSRIGGLIRFLRLLLQSVALGLGAWLAIHRHISAGSIFAASMLASRALAPMDQVVSQWRSMSQAITAFAALKGQLVRDETAVPTLLPAPKPDLAVIHATVIAPGARPHPAAGHQPDGPRGPGARRPRTERGWEKHADGIDRQCARARPGRGAYRRRAICRLVADPARAPHRLPAPVAQSVSGIYQGEHLPLRRRARLRSILG